MSETLKIILILIAIAIRVVPEVSNKLTESAPMDQILGKTLIFSCWPTMCSVLWASFTERK